MANDPSRRILIGLALVLAGAVAASQTGPFLERRARTKRGEFCARLLAGKVGEASQMIPEDSRTDFIHGAKELPVSCAEGTGTGSSRELVLRYADASVRRLDFVYKPAPFTTWTYARLVEVDAAPR